MMNSWLKYGLAAFAGGLAQLAFLPRYVRLHLLPESNVFLGFFLLATALYIYIKICTSPKKMLEVLHE